MSTCQLLCQYFYFLSRLIMSILIVLLRVQQGIHVLRMRLVEHMMLCGLKLLRLKLQILCLSIVCLWIVYSSWNCLLGSQILLTRMHHLELLMMSLLLPIQLLILLYSITLCCYSLLKYIVLFLNLGLSYCCFRMNSLLTLLILKFFTKVNHFFLNFSYRSLAWLLFRLCDCEPLKLFVNSFFNDKRYARRRRYSLCEELKSLVRQRV